MKILKCLLPFLVIVLCINCSNDDTIQTIDNIEYHFTGTLNGEAFNFDNSNIVIGESTDNNTNEKRYELRSSFGNPSPIPNSDGVEFFFFFQEKPSYDNIMVLDGQDILESTVIGTFLRIKVVENGEIYTTETGVSNNDFFTIESIEIDENLTHENIVFETGRVIAISGEMQLSLEDIEVVGSFTLKLVEIL